MKPKRLLVYILLTNLICTFPAGHAIIPLGIFEPILIANAISGSNESPTLWIASAGLLVIGQLVVVLALVQTKELRISRFGLIGIMTLTLAIMSVYFTMPEQLWPITLLTAIPFIILSFSFVKRHIDQSM